MQLSIRNQITIVCLPPAGASSSYYRSWTQYLPEWLEIFSPEIPGRLHRFNHDRPESFNRLAMDLGDTIRNKVRSEFAIFGHSMGAILAFEIACYLNSQRDICPKQIFISSSHSPLRARIDDNWDADKLLPRHLLDHQELRDLTIKILTDDLKLFSKYDVPVGRLTHFPITVLVGRDDETVEIDSLLEWKALTTGRFELITFSGDHHYLIHPETQNVVNAIVTRLSG